ncbi:conserved hypothetical protein [Gammaproteobacteria bacterium]
MTPTGTLIRDGWVFGLIPESETGEGWTTGQLEVLYEKIFHAWEPYGHLPSRLPEGLLERHRRIYGEALVQARRAGWDPSLEHEEE